MSNPSSETTERQGNILMRFMLFTVMISSMSALMFNIVLPQIGEEFRLSLPEVSWLSTAYTLIYAFGTVTYGKLADRFQLKSLLTFGLTLFAAGSLLGFLSQSFAMALVGRCLQSAGAAAVPAMALMIPIRYFPAEKRGSAISMTAVGIALGGALGPVVAALLASVAGWRWLFVPSLLMIALIPLFRKHLKDEPLGEIRKFDWLGGLLLAASSAAILLGVTQRSWVYGAAGVAALILFVWRIRTIKSGDPFVQPRLFRNREYTVMLVLSFLISCFGISLYFLTPILLSNVYHLEAGWIGLAMVPAAIASSILGRKGGKLSDRRGNAYLLSIASCLLIVCFLLLSIFAGVAAPWISVFLIFGNVGQSFVQIAMSNAVSRTLPKDQAGVGMGLFSMINFISQGIAAGVYGVLAISGTSITWNPLNAFPSSATFSNLYLVLAGLHILILLVYRMRFAPRKLETVVAVKR
ncbi:MFS transporter [Paenibacillus sp. LHD-117]|uniref:MFS transporter n=1 Tax=Paenibacillus sp. LHD-117 TaxID=3071412 RepID=UPI0027E1F1EE|nr:MFS transporter [Paenibacillus sp. LHD-117]MDQ6420059.1 MFS transporter [Paenibacillus sp. LHD-117]